MYKLSDNNQNMTLMTQADQLYQHAIQAISSGNAAQAEQVLTQLIALVPRHPDAHALLGHSLQRQGKLQSAISAFTAQLNLFTPSAQSYTELAGALVAAGEHVKAEASYRQAVTLEPRFAEGWLHLGNLLMQQNRPEDARECFIQAERHDPWRDVFVQVSQAMQQKAWHQAEKLCREVLQAHGHHSQALYILARLAEQTGEYEQAVSILQHGLSYAPWHASLLELLVKNLVHCGQQQAAVDTARTLLRCRPDHWQYHKMLAIELANAGQFEDALESYNAALALRPDDANLHLLQGHVLKTLGQRKACEQAYRRSLTLQPVNGTAWWALADLKSYRFDNDDVSALKSLAEDHSIALAQRSQAAFTLAKALEDRGDYEQAFHRYEHANTLRPDVQFNAGFYEKSCDIIRRGYTAEVLSRQAKPDASQPVPIFIVGLTRSGSTLLEQILASHPGVEGTMELYSLPRTVRRAERLARQKGTDYPAIMANLSEHELRALGQSYLDETAIYRTGKRYFIDKMPPNFHNVGFIHMILPQAVIIDARRHPLAAGFSNYKQHYARGYDFSYSLKNIGVYYNAYLKLMDYWDEVLPGKVLCMQYEQLVRETETQVRRLLTHCGLDFNAACLDFYTNQRAVRTASSEQVRQPIYTKGIEQWQHFSAQLQPLRESLGEATLTRFSEFT